MADRYFRIGPVDRLVRMPVPDDEVPATPSRIGTTVRSLNGTATTQTFGYKRSWNFLFEYMSPDEFADLEALYLEDVQGPYRMFDPVRKNLLNREVSAPSSLDEGVGFSASTTANATLSLAHIVPGASPTARSSRKLKVVSTGANDVRRAEGKAWDAFMLGNDLTFSCWVDNISGAAPTPYMQFKDRAGVNVGTRLSGSATTDAGFGRVSVSATPPAGAYLVEVGLNSSAANEFDTTGWQLEYGTSATDWVPGYGVPVVTIDTMELIYPRYDFYNAQVTVLEV